MAPDRLVEDGQLTLIIAQALDLPDKLTSCERRTLVCRVLRRRHVTAKRLRRNLCTHRSA